MGVSDSFLAEEIEEVRDETAACFLTLLAQSFVNDLVVVVFVRLYPMDEILATYFARDQPGQYLSRGHHFWIMVVLDFFFMVLKVFGSL